MLAGRGVTPKGRRGVDATIAPILWRLPAYRIELPTQAQPVVRYMNNLFARPGFRASLSVPERVMRR